MYRCPECGEIFDAPLIARDSHGLPGGFFEEFCSCPCCGGGKFEQAVKCQNCGDWMPESQGEFGLCEKCEAKADAKYDMIQAIAHLYLKENELAYINWKAEAL